MTAHSNTLDLVAKLLANENINIIQSNVDTASFDIMSRTLTIPQWDGLSSEVYAMLQAHEISHALFTTTEYYDLSKDLDIPNAHSYLNILEDVRVEKLVKRKYPGLRKTFRAGYNELNERDFFGVGLRDLTNIHLMDKINLYYKVGHDCGVTFNTQEKEFVLRTEKTETISDVVQLARDIYNYVKLQQEKAKEQESNVEESPDEDDDEDFGNSQEREITTSSWNNNESSEEEEEDDEGDNSEYDDGEESDDQSDDDAGAAGNGGFDDDVDEDDTEEGPTSTDPEDGVEGPTTDEIFSKTLQRHANSSTIYKYWTVGSYNFDPIIPYKTVIKHLSDARGKWVMGAAVKHAQRFMQDHSNTIGHMIKEFEMRKAATAYKRSTVSKSGSLDMKRVWSYKLNDDLFRRVTQVQEGKSHAMLFLLDWSSSMRGSLDSTIEQLLNVVLFCRRAQIPFEVYAFSDDISATQYGTSISPNKPKIDELAYRAGRFALIELLSSKMTTSEFNSMVGVLSDGGVQYSFHLSCTPLNEALVHVYNYFETFQRKHNVEKTIFITLTDGEGGSLSCGITDKQYRRNEFDEFTRHDPIDVVNYVTDKTTKKTFPIDGDGNRQTIVLLKMIKDRYNCVSLGFVLAKPSTHNVSRVMYCNTAIQRTDTIPNLKELVSRIRGDGYCSVAGTGRDDLFILPLRSRIAKGDLNVDGKGTAKSIASKLTKHMTSKKTSRILLNKFIGYVA